MKVITITTLNKKLEAEWEALWQNSLYATYANSPYWFLSVIKTFDYKEYVVLACYENEKLVGIAGFVKEKLYGVTVYTLPPGDFVCGDVFLLDWENKRLVKALMRELLALQATTFNNLPENIVDVFHKITRQLSVKKQTINLFFPITKNENGAVVIPKRSRLTNRIKGIEDQFTMKTFDGTTSNGLDVVFSIDKESSKEKSGYSTFADDEIKKFYKNLARQFGEKFLIVVLYYNNQPIAYYLGFISNTTYFWSQNAYISLFGQYSPGKVLLVKLIDYLGTKEIKNVDFGSGDYRLKRLLTDEYHNLYQVIMSKNILIRFYLQFLNTIKNSVYEIIHNNKMVYMIYRKGTKLVKNIL